MKPSEILRVIDEELKLTVSKDGRVRWSTTDWLSKSASNPRSRRLCADCKKAWCCLTYKRVHLSLLDVKRLSKHLNLSTEEFIKAHCEPTVDSDRRFLYLLKNTQPCEFLKDNWRCAVYEHRPIVCEMWPFVVDESTRQISGVNVQYFCNVVFNMLRYELTLRVLRAIRQKRVSPRI